MKWFTRATLSLVVGLASLAALGPASADEPTQPATMLTLKTSPRQNEKGVKVKGELNLTVTLTTKDDKPVNNRRVDFYVPVELLGSREAHIGTATTDSTGVANLLYHPAEAGQQQVNVRFLGDDSYAASEASVPIDVAEAVPLFEVEPQPLGIVRLVFPFGIGFLVIGIWAVLLGVLLGTLVGIRAAASAPEPTRQPAMTPAASSSREEVPY